MQVVTFTELRNNLKQVLDHAVNDLNPIYIRRPNNTDVIMIDKHSYDSLIETAYLLGNETNATHLRKSIQEIKKGKKIKKTLKELLA